MRRDVSGGVTRRWVVRRAAALGAAGVAACAPPGQSGLGGGQPGAGPPATIEYFAGLNERQLGNFQTLLVDAFQKTQPSIALSVIATGGTDTLLALMAAGTPPDVSSSAKPKEYLTKQVQDITQYVQRGKVNAGVFPKDTFEATCTWRGRNINLPNEFGGTWPVMPYNRNLFRQAGVPEPPATWGDPPGTSTPTSRRCRNSPGWTPTERCRGSA
jgi:ABC-type glycerol-3-phosphate transport system substrate-binding protein